MSGKSLKTGFKAAGQIPQDEHLGQANAKKVTMGLIPAATSQTATSTQTTAVFVGKGNICRIRVTGATFINFGPSTVVTPAVGTEASSIELNTAGVYFIVASDDYMSSSIALGRCEIFAD